MHQYWNHHEKIQNNATQESHGDWMAAEHNSAVANNLKQKYGKNSCNEDIHNYNDFIMTVMMIIVVMNNLKQKYHILNMANSFLIMRMMATKIIKTYNDGSKNYKAYNDDDDDDKAYDDYDICRSIWHPLPCCLQKGWNPCHKGWACRSYWHGKGSLHSKNTVFL